MKIAKQNALYSQHFAHPNQPNCILVASGVVRIILYCKFDRASSWMCAASCYLEIANFRLLCPGSVRKLTISGFLVPEVSGN